MFDKILNAPLYLITDAFISLVLQITINIDNNT